MKRQLPKLTETIETLTVNEATRPHVENFISRNIELEDIFEAIQPLLYKVSTSMYTEATPVQLGDMISDAVEYITDLEEFKKTTLEKQNG